jgi:subtilisin-like proprotein convertase family protein
MKKHLLALLLLAALLLQAVTGIAQPFINGNLSTGSTTVFGNVPAPPGYTWSELQSPNTTLAVNASVSSGLSVLDNFTVPLGQRWNISKFSFFGYSTGYVDTSSPFNLIYFRIFNTDPTKGNANPVFGNFSTNRFSKSYSAKLYRIRLNTPNTDREIWTIESNVSLILPEGDYWIEWQLGTKTGITSNFSPTSTFKQAPFQPGNNAWIRTLADDTWTEVIDQGSGFRQDMPFIVDYSIIFPNNCEGVPNPGNTVSSPNFVCQNQRFTLSLQNDAFETGLGYQWQISTNNSTWTNIPQAVNKTFDTSQSAARYYRAMVTCGTDTGYSISKLVSFQTSSIGSQPASVTATCSESTFFRVTKGGTSPFVKYQWQQRTSSTAAWTNMTNTSTISGTDDDTLRLFQILGGQNGYQFRVLCTDTCGALLTSNIATLTVSLPKARLSFPSNSICFGQKSNISLNNIQTVRSVFSSPNFSLTIPDTLSAGTTHSISVSGIPSDATVIGLSVRTNISHALIGELAIALKAPNGNVINLDYYLSSTFGKGAGTGFNNTVFSSNGTRAIGDSIDPFTGVFKADAIIPGAGSFPAGPTSVTPNTRSWSSLYSLTNGTWTLGLYDGASGDQGTLQSWSLEIIYTVPGKATWTASPAGSMFTDSLLTVPYVAGTRLNRIHVRPLSNTTYTASLNATACTGSSPTSVAYTVSGIGNFFPKDTIAICDSSYLLDAGVHEKYNWSNGDTTRTVLVRKSGTFICTVRDGNCSIADTVVVRLKNTNFSKTIVTCSSYVWNGSTYTQSGVYTKSLVYDTTCSAVDTLKLTVNSGSFNSTTQIACDKYEWNGNTYTDGGTYLYRYTNNAGCPSVDTLKLSLKYSTNSSEIASNCNSYTWKGTVYRFSGLYLYNFINTVGCPSTDSLFLRINYGTFKRELRSECLSYNWFGTIYTQSGSYARSYINEFGCESNDSLILIINKGTFNSFTVQSPDYPYIWYGLEYRTPGTYTHSYTDQYGCASVDTLKLTFIPGITSFSPGYGSKDSVILIKGNNFKQVTDVRFGGVPAVSFTVIDSSTISAKLGTGETGNITVTSVTGSGSKGTFYYYEIPDITSFTPLSASNRGTVTIKGKKLNRVSFVNFGNTPAYSFSILNDSTISAVVSIGTSGSVKIGNPIWSDSLSGFTFLSSAPIVSSFSPTTACNSGTLVTVRGVNLLKTTGVQIGGVNIPFNIVSDTVLTFTTGIGYNSGPIRVANVAGSASSTGELKMSSLTSNLKANPDTIKLCQGQSRKVLTNLPDIYTYNCSNGQSGKVITVSTAGNYILTVRDTLGCGLSSNFTVVNNPDCSGYLEILADSIVNYFDTLSVRVWVQQGRQVGEVKAHLKYDTAQLKLVAQSSGTYLGNDALVTNPINLPGIFKFGLTKSSLLTGANGSGQVYSFRFVLNDRLPSTTGFSLTSPNFFRTMLSLDSINVTDTGRRNLSSFNTQSLTRKYVACRYYVPIWPGDHNNDRAVTAADILPIGYFLGASGLARLNASNNWVAQPAQLFGLQKTFKNGTAYRTFADGNGNLIVGLTDTVPLKANMGKTHSGYLIPAISDTVLKPRFSKLLPALKINIRSNTIYSSDSTFTEDVDVFAGDSSIPFSTLYGLAFNLYFDTNYVNMAGISSNFTGSILGTASNMIRIEDRTALSKGRIGIGITRYNTTELITRGEKILSLRVPVKPRRPSGKLKISVIPIEANDKAGNPLALTGSLDSATVIQDTGCQVNYWTGTVDTKWEDRNNWSCNSIPDSNTVVIISSGKINYPVVNSAAKCRSVYIDPAAIIIVNRGYRLNVFGKE